ncbi:MAG: GNAT family N-acetyltransferase [Myxococcota bacterium]
MPVRDARLTDVNTLVRGNCAMARETEGLELDPDRMRTGVEAVFADASKGRYWIEEFHGATRGQLLVTYEWSDWRNAPVWWIQSVYVWPEARVRGVFRSLYAHVDQEAKAAGAAGLRLYVDLRNQSAQQVYERLGMDGGHYRLFEAMF